LEWHKGNRQRAKHYLVEPNYRGRFRAATGQSVIGHSPLRTRLLSQPARRHKGRPSRSGRPSEGRSRHAVSVNTSHPKDGAISKRPRASSPISFFSIWGRRDAQACLWCPETQQPVDLQLYTDYATLARIWSRSSVGIPVGQSGARCIPCLGAPLADTTVAGLIFDGALFSRRSHRHAHIPLWLERRPPPIPPTRGRLRSLMS